jgi:hypothetical protein
MEDHQMKNLGDKLLSEIGNLPDSWKAGLSSNYYRFIFNENAAAWVGRDLEGMNFTINAVERIQS